MQRKPIIQELSSVEFSQPAMNQFGSKEEQKNEIVESSMASTPTSNSTKISKQKQRAMKRLHKDL